ncbi:MAG: hypothetical protein KF683_01200, partial [Rubrivivax sp.]|nr:hypothetical protein [Rubrivivax sp.]
MPVYIDPTRPTNGTGTFADPRNTWVGITWSASETYLQRAETVFAGAASIGPSQNNITFGTYDPATGAQITDNTRHATIANVGGQGINCNSRTGLVIDNLRIIGDASATSRHAIQALYATSTTALNLTVRRCILSAETTSSAPLRVRGDGLLVEDCVLTGTGVAVAALYGDMVNATIRRSTLTCAANTALFVTTTANTETEPVNLLVEESTLNAYGATVNAGDGATVRGRGITFRRCRSDAAWDNSVLIRGQNIVLEDNKFRGYNLSNADGDGVQLVGTHDVLSLRVSGNTIGSGAFTGAKQCAIFGDSGATAPTGSVNVIDNICEGMAFGIICNIPNARIKRNTIRGQTGSCLVLSANGIVAQS